MMSEIVTDNNREKFSMQELILLLLSTLTVMVGATIAPALPEIQASFAGTPNLEVLVRLTLTIPGLFIAFFAPLMGYIVDKWGRTKLLIITTFIYGISGPSAFFFDSLEAIIISRALLGVAVAGIMTATTTLIADYYHGEQRNKVMGYQAGFMAFGGLIFIISGGFLAGIGFKFVFLIYLAALPLVPGIWKYLHEPDRSAPEKLTGEVQSSSDFIELRIPYLSIVVAYSSVLILQILFFFTVTELPFFLTSELLLEPELIGLILASITLTAGSFSLLYKQIKQHFSFIAIFIASYLLFGLGSFIIFISPTIPGIILALLVSGIGLGLFIPNLTVWITTVTPESSIGRILSGFTTFLFLGQFLSPFVSQALLRIMQFNEMFALSSATLFLIVIVFSIANYSLKSRNKPIDDLH